MPEYCRATLAQRRLFHPGRGTHPQVADLTERQTEVLRAIAKGLNSAEIAATVHVTESTVKRTWVTYRSSSTRVIAGGL